MASVVEIADEEAWAKFTKSQPKDQIAFIFFHTPWAASCPQVEKVIQALALESKSPDISWFSVNAEELAHVSETYGVTAVPAVVVLRGEEVLDRLGWKSWGHKRWHRKIYPKPLVAGPFARCC